MNQADFFNTLQATAKLEPVLRKAGPQRRKVIIEQSEEFHAVVQNRIANAEAARVTHIQKMNADARESWKCCWPEWEGPRVGGFCSAGISARTIDDGGGYFYAEECRVLAVHGDIVIAMIDMEHNGKPWVKNGTLLRMHTWEVWAPVNRLWKARHAAEAAEKAQRGDHCKNCNGPLNDHDPDFCCQGCSMEYQDK